MEDKRKSGGGIIGAEAGQKRILPRVLRKPARLLDRLLAGNLMISAREWTIIALTGIIVVCAGVAVNVRQNHSVLSEVLANMGFGIDKVIIEGVHAAPEDDVMDLLEIDSASLLFSFDIKKARENLLNLEWVRDAVVKKIYPDQLVVHIEEYAPFAIWQSDNVLSLIEKDGRRIGRFRKKFANLPFLVGKGANAYGFDIVSRVKQETAFEKQVKAYVRIANQRWDLWLENGTIVRLPNKNVNKALKRLVWLDDTYGLLSRDVATVDLRLKNRLIVALRQSVPRRGGVESENLNFQGSREKRI